MRIVTPILFAILVTALITPSATANELDAVGNYVVSGPAGTIDTGDVCGTCPEPTPDTGMDFQGTELIAYGSSPKGGDDSIHRLQACGTVDVVTLVPPPGWGFDIGFDSSRNLYVVTDVVPDRVHQYDLNGNLVQSWNTPFDGTVGATYDPIRDVYWICSWLMNSVYAMDPDTGVPGVMFQVPAGSRIAGTGYDALNDAIVYHGRDQKKGYFMSATDGSLLQSYDVPFAGDNNGQGCGVDPITHNVWISHHEMTDIYCIEGLGVPTAVDQVTWGGLKNLFR